MKKKLYPCIDEVEKERKRVESESKILRAEPDIIGGKPNYNKYKNWSVEETLTWLNID